ncbi:MAG: hypothetical protein C0597_05990 [Marinilabiliales bacterium]|nr:MAG: hypothetical protein C0597_05990 [Marinilabiliales bacterium]
MVKYTLLFYFILLFTPNYIYAQSFNFRHFTPQDGLPSSEVYHAFQDSKGYIWFATDNGVSRYDGYEFRNFSQKDGLPDNTVFEIYEDYQNRIWFVPHSAKFSYFKNDSIFEYKYNDQLQKKLQLSSNPNKLSFYIDSLDNLYYGDVYNGGFIVDRYGGTKKIKNFDGIINLLLINNKLILNTLTDNSKSGDNINFIHLISVDTILNKLPNKTRQNRHIGFAKNENVFIATNNFLLHLMEKRLNAKKLKHPILWISEDRENNLWTGTRKGAYKFESFNIDKEPCLHILKNKNITSVLQDSEGGYWFTTLLNGVYYTPAFSVLNFKNDSILSKSVYAISADKKSNWLGLNNKIVKLATLTEKELINLDKDNVIIKDIFHDTNNDKVWIASRFLYSIGKKNVIKHSFKYKSNITTGAQPKGIISKENGEVWLATSIGIFKSSKENFFEPVSNDIKYKIKFNSICLDKTETKIYCWSNDGLCT